MDDKVLKTMESLKQNGMGAKCFDTSDEAVDYLLSVIPGDASVGIGGSMTVSSIGIVDRLRERGNRVLFHWLDKTPEEVKKTRRDALNADIYMSSTNALTMDGKLINTDGVGNRVASMFFGPQKVYIVCGINKIVENVDQGLERVKEAAYLNAKRLKLDTPCIKAGKCVDCKTPQRICNVTVIINSKPSTTDIEVLIINQNLGY